MSHAKRVTPNKKQNPKYNVVVVIRRLQTDKNCPAENTWLNHVKHEHHITEYHRYFLESFVLILTSCNAGKGSRGGGSIEPTEFIIVTAMVSFLLHYKSL